MTTAKRFEEFLRKEHQVWCDRNGLHWKYQYWLCTTKPGIFIELAAKWHDEETKDGNKNTSTK